VKVSAKDDPYFATFAFIDGKSTEMRSKISKALRLLQAGREISIKAFSQKIERVICMTEIIKDRIGKPIFQHTTFLKD
jgi:DNA-binding protein